MTESSEEHNADTRLQILVVSTYFAPDVCGIAPIVADLCLGLTQKGHAVTVLTSYPHYPEWKYKENCRPWSRRTEVQPDGTEVIRHGAFIPKKPSRIPGRLCYEFSMLLSLFRSLRMRGRRFDVMYVVCPSIGNVLFARMRAWISNEPVVVCLQDIPADAANSTGLAGKWLGKLATAVQRLLLRPVETLTTISPVMAERIRETVHPRQPVLLTPNWLAGEMGAAVERSHKQCSDSGRKKLLSLFYSGNIGNKQGLAAFCKTAEQLDLPFQMTIHGDGAAAGELHDQLEQSGDARFHHGPLLSADAFVDRLMRTDWFVITEKAGVGTAVMPSKLIPAVSRGVPTLAICDPMGALGQAVTNNQLGICLAWDELDELQHKLTATSDEQIEAYRQNCLTFSRTYDRVDCIGAIECVLQDASAAKRIALAAPVAGGCERITDASLGSRLRASGVWAGTGRILSGVLLLAVHAVLARSLDGAAYGQFVLAESIALLTVTLCLAGVPSVALRMIRERLSRHDAPAAANVARSSIVLVVATSLSAMVVLSFSSRYLTGPLPGGLSSHWLTWIAAWAIFATGLRLLSEIYKGYDRYSMAYSIGGQSGGLLVNGILFLSILTLATTGQLALRTAFSMQLIVQGTVLVLSAVNMHRSLTGLGGQRVSDSGAVYRLMILAAFPLLVEQMVSVGLPEVGKLILGTFSTPEATGLYNAALRLILLAHVPLLVINSAIQPFVAELHASGRIDRLTTLSRGSATIASIPSVVLLAILFFGAEQILSLAFGHEFVAAAPALRWLVVGSLAFVLSGSCGLVLIMTGREKECMLATILPGIVYVAACPFAVLHFGPTGAAACAAGLHVASNALCLLLVRFHLGMWTSVTLSTDIFRDCLRIVRRLPSAVSASPQSVS